MWSCDGARRNKMNTRLANGCVVIAIRKGGEWVTRFTMNEAFPPSVDADAPSDTIQEVGGEHYDKMPIDVFEFCEVNGLGFVESTAIKYIARRKGETRIEDLRKAINCIERLIKHEETGSWGR